MINIFRMKARTIINQLMQSDEFALIRYNNEEGNDHSLEVIVPRGRFIFTACDESYIEMDNFMEGQE